MTARYVIGIDLGTTNSVLAYAPLKEDAPTIRLLEIPQLVAAGVVESLAALPSFAYLASEHESGGDSLDLPWDSGRDYAVGAYARKQGADVPDRTVAAAKSWLCHSRVDRHQPLLPHGAPEEVPKISPVTAARRYLEHLISAWEHAFPDAPIAQQQIVLTVPASFDASARELTREAALAAGLPESLVLLEEPQAALYAWLADQGDRWRETLTVDETLLVCDVGGGTTDLTLVQVTEADGELALSRMAVGDHLLVGGDNMDLALAHHAAELFGEKRVKLDPWQSVALWHSCRAAKEALLAEDGPKKHPVAVLGRGSKLVGGTVTVQLDRERVGQLLVDGFCPKCDIKDRPQQARASGFQEIGLPYASDTAVTRHLAAFLAAHGGKGAVRPTHVLLGGGVFKSQRLRARLMEVLGGWFGEDDTAPRELAGSGDLDYAVARGAAHYGWSKEHGGVRIRGGTGRSYYVGIETAGLAVPGAPRPMRALCVAPFGMEEGTELDVPGGEIGLVVGEPATFRFFSSTIRKQDQPGELLEHWDDDELAESDSMEATLSADNAIDESYVPVRFHTKVTELGTLELWCASTKTDGRWKLEFSVREDADATPAR